MVELRTALATFSRKQDQLLAKQDQLLSKQDQLLAQARSDAPKQDQLLARLACRPATSRIKIRYLILNIPDWPNTAAFEESLTRMIAVSDLGFFAFT